MAIGTTAALAIGIGVAVAGATSATISAATKKDPKYDTTGINAVKMQDQSVLGADGQATAQQGLSQMKNLTNDQSFAANQDLASLLQQYSTTGGVPTAADQQNANQYASSQFNPQQVALQQQFQQQQFQANQQAALSGRGINDPVLKARLAQSQAQQATAISAQQSAFASQYANQLSQQRVGYAEGRSNVLTQNFQQQLGLANNIFSAGLQAQSQDYAQRFGLYQQQLQTQQNIAAGGFAQDQASVSVGERIGAGINGGIAGLGAGMKTYGTLSGTGMANPFDTSGGKK